MSEINISEKHLDYSIEFLRSVETLSKFLQIEQSFHQEVLAGYEGKALNQINEYRDELENQVRVLVSLYSHLENSLRTIILEVIAQDELMAMKFFSKYMGAGYVSEGQIGVSKQALDAEIGRREGKNSGT